MKSKLQSLIAEGKTSAVIDELISLTKKDSELHNQVIQISARLEEIEKQNRLGITDNSFLNTERNKINNALISIIDRLYKAKSTEGISSYSAPNSVPQKRWMKIGGAFVVAITLIAGIVQITGYSIKDFIVNKENPNTLINSNQAIISGEKQQMKQKSKTLVFFDYSMSQDDSSAINIVSNCAKELINKSLNSELYFYPIGEEYNPEIYHRNPIDTMTLDTKIKCDADIEFLKSKITQFYEISKTDERRLSTCLISTLKYAYEVFSSEKKKGNNDSYQILILSDMKEYCVDKRNKPRHYDLFSRIKNRKDIDIKYYEQDLNFNLAELGVNISIISIPPSQTNYFITSVDDEKKIRNFWNQIFEKIGYNYNNYSLITYSNQLPEKLIK
jgi:hypothetical protein